VKRLRLTVSPKQGLALTPQGPEVYTVDGLLSAAEAASAVAAAEAAGFQLQGSRGAAHGEVHPRVLPRLLSLAWCAEEPARARRRRGSSSSRRPARPPNCLSALQAYRDNYRLAFDDAEQAAQLWSTSGLEPLCAGLEADGRRAVGLNANLRLYKWGSPRKPLSCGDHGRVAIMRLSMHLPWRMSQWMRALKSGHALPQGNISSKGSLCVFRYVAGQRFGKHVDDSVELGRGRATAYTLLVYLSGGEAAAGPARLAGGETVFYGAPAASRLRVWGSRTYMCLAAAAFAVTQSGSWHYSACCRSGSPLLHASRSERSHKQVGASKSCVISDTHVTRQDMSAA